MNGLLMQEAHFVQGLAPVADAFSGTVGGDVVSMRGHKRFTAVVYKGVGATGTSTITVEACSDVTPSATSAIPFWYRAVTTGDTPGTLTRATSAGFTTTAGSNQMYIIEVDANELNASGYEFIRVKAVEVVDSAVAGSIAYILSDPRYATETHPSVIS